MIEQLFPAAFEFAQPQWIHTVWVIALLIVAGLLISRFRGQAAQRFADSDRLSTMLGTRRNWLARLRAAMMIAGLLLIAGSTMRPRANPHQETTETLGRDIVFVVDVSKSMLVRDVAPNRLERAKLWITDLVAELKTDRVALVAFAGSSSVQSPLTTDRLFFGLALDELSPEVVDVGGTNIGDAIRKCMDMVFYDLEESEAQNHRDIILITDGEDQDSLPIEAAQAAGAMGIRILALGIGSEAGAVITDDKNRALRNNGAVVRSRLESGTLSKIATATPGGAYLDIGTGDIDLAQVYQELIARGNPASIGNANITRWDELYAAALAPGMALIFMEMALGFFRIRKDPT